MKHSFPEHSHRFGKGFVGECETGNLAHLLSCKIKHVQANTLSFSPHNTRGVYSYLSPPPLGGGKRNQKIRNREEKSKEKRGNENEEGQKKGGKEKL